MAGNKKEGAAPPSTITTNDDKSKDIKKDVTPQLPPVEAAARRLERLYGGGGLSTKTTATALPINTTKIMKKWLGASSGTAGNATMASVAACAEKTLDPAGVCVTGREILMGLCSEEERLAVAVTKVDDGTADKPEGGDAMMEEDAA